MGNGRVGVRSGGVGIWWKELYTPIRLPGYLKVPPQILLPSPSCLLAAGSALCQAVATMQCSYYPAPALMSISWGWGQFREVYVTS